MTMMMMSFCLSSSSSSSSPILMHNKNPNPVLVLYNHPHSKPSSSSSSSCFRTKAIQEKSGEKENQSSDSVDEITNKFGLEAALWKIFTSKKQQQGTSVKSKGDEAKELLAKYGGAYLATSITLSLISFSLCYALVNAGVDVQALLQRVGISATDAGNAETLGTFALAYAAHKAASPIRFPPTVALTPIVAAWIGKKQTP